MLVVELLEKLIHMDGDAVVTIKDLKGNYAHIDSIETDWLCSGCGSFDLVISEDALIIDKENIK